MPVDFELKIIFVHIPKTGGSSIEHIFDLQQPSRLFSCDVLPVLQHLIPSALRTRMQPDEWISFFKFTVIRNPYDRIVSEYHWRKTHNLTTLSFEDFLHEARDVVRRQDYYNTPLNDHFIPQVDYFKDIEYDFVLKFENLSEDFLELLNKLSLPKMELPKTNCSNRTSSEYRHYFDSITKSIVEEIYGEDIQFFGYNF